MNSLKGSRSARQAGGTFLTKVICGYKEKIIFVNEFWMLSDCMSDDKDMNRFKPHTTRFLIL